MGLEDGVCARHFLVDVRLHCAERVSSASRSLRHSPGPIESRIGVCVRAAVSTAGHQSVGFQETAEFGLRRDFLASHGRGLRPSKYHSNGSIESSSHGQGNRSIISFLIPFNSFFFFFRISQVEVVSDRTTLHSIESNEFLDSPEFESSRAAGETKFRVHRFLLIATLSDEMNSFWMTKVSIVAVCPSRYLSWQRSSLEYLFAKETHLATVFGVLVSRDVISKVCAMSKKVSHCFQCKQSFDVNTPPFLCVLIREGGTAERSGSRYSLTVR